MPIIKSAIKKMRQDKARTITNRGKISILKKVLKQATTKPSSENISIAFSSLDKAAKKGLIPKARANRKKSQLSSKETTPTLKKSTKIKKQTSKRKSD